MTSSDKDRRQNAVEGPKHFNIFDSHYYKLYKLLHNINGSWPNQKFFRKFITTTYEWSGGSIILAGQVRSS